MDTNGNGWVEHKRDVLHRLDALEDRMTQQEQNCLAHQKTQAEVMKALGQLEGRIAGYAILAAALGSILSVLGRSLLTHLGG